MTEHISYAMRNAEATQSLVYFNKPSDLLDWSFLAIECMLLAGVILAIVHACRYYKKTGSPSALLTLLGCFLYGLSIDILSYYTVENFWHGEFSVMFLYNRLPLYIALFYPAFMYHACMLVRRYDFGPLTEAISVGFYGGFMYLIFDNLGPLLNWWVWDTSDLTTLPYVNSVPLTSYHWFFTFTVAFSFINRIISWDWIEKQKPKSLILSAIAVQPILTILIGSLLFIPYNLFAKNMPPYDMLPWAQNLTLAALVHVVTFSAAGFIFWSNWKKPVRDQDKLLMVFPFIYLAGLAYIYIAKLDLLFSENGVNLLAGNLIAVLLAMLGVSTIVIASHQKNQGI